jgi:hypothetical protein
MSFSSFSFFKALYNVAEQIIAPYPDLCKGWLGPFLLIDVRNPEYIKKLLLSDKCLDRADFYLLPYKTGLLQLKGGERELGDIHSISLVFSKNISTFLVIFNQTCGRSIAKSSTPFSTSTNSTSSCRSSTTKQGNSSKYSREKPTMVQSTSFVSCQH